MTRYFIKMKKYKAILALLIAIVTLNIAKAQTKGKYVKLFDGKTLNGWVSAKDTTQAATGWSIDHGVLSLRPPAGKEIITGGDIITKAEYSAFDLTFEFKTTPAANSGVKYFVTVDKAHGALGLEYQVLDDALNPDAKLGRDGDRTESSLYDLIPAKKDSTIYKPVGQWNTGRIIVYPNNHVEHYLNGVKVLEYERLSPEFKALIAISKYKNYPGFGTGPQGHILLQDHGCAVSFRNIKIKVLK
jgi:hypothetical protein